MQKQHYAYNVAKAYIRTNGFYIVLQLNGFPDNALSSYKMKLFTIHCCSYLTLN